MNASNPNYIDINYILNRECIKNEIKIFLTQFHTRHNDITFKKGIYIYGSPGCGKTEFILNILKEMDYDTIKYDAGDVRNKSLIETITSNNISNCNVLQMMNKTKKKIAIVMDEIDGMNNGDKGGITSLIKLIRQKKTKKQKLENKTMNPIICIGNYYMDKKIKELMKVCNTYELKTPTQRQMAQLINMYIPNLYKFQSSTMKETLLHYVQGDLRKLEFVYNLFDKKSDIITEEILQKIFQTKLYNEDAKKTTQKLINSPINIKEHTTFIDETDRTTMALLWHENIVDMLNKTRKNVALPFYHKILQNICFADYTDRITFQNQLWQFNEMTSLIKTFHNNKIFHDTFPDKKGTFKPEEVRFTKVLTKYSTEYNNILFIFNLCQELDMDKKDLVSFFQELRLFFGKEFYNNQECLLHVCNLFENNNISKLDLKRIYRYLDKNVKRDAVVINEDEDDASDSE
jgi:DNA polymerase III delta prime subunit